MKTFAVRSADGQLSLVTSPVYVGGAKAFSEMQTCDHAFAPVESSADVDERVPDKPNCKMILERCRCGASRCRTIGPEEELLKGTREIPT